MIELITDDIKLLYKSYLLKCLLNDIDTKIDEPPVSYKVFKKQLKTYYRNGKINEKDSK